VGVEPVGVGDLIPPGDAVNLRAPFTWLDSHAQRVVDAGMFFVMRKAGWKKSFIRYAIRAVCIALWAVGVMSGPLGTTGTVLVAVVAPVLLIFQHIERRVDERLEADGRTWRLTPFRWLWWAFLLAMEPLALWAGSPLRREIVWSALWITELVAAYSDVTPPRPPAERETERTPVLVPARSRT
jgi:hypothetical protein